MVEKKLNFNQPILSVRRHSPKIVDERKGNNINAFPLMHWLPPQRSEPKSGPVRIPGAVPFHWEQSPGRPKEDILAHQVASSTSDNVTSDQFFDESSSKSSVGDGLDLDAVNQVIRLESAARRSQAEERRKYKVVNQDKSVLVHCRPSFENSFFHYKNKEEKEGSDDHNVEDEHENVITVCCLLPRSCLKTSTCNLNPVPAMSLMNRVMTFPASRFMSGSSLMSSSSTDQSENYEYAVAELREREVVTKKSFKTLQELLMADEGSLKVKKENEFHDASETNIKTSDEMNMNIGDSSSEEEEDMHIRIAVNKATNNAKRQLLRARTLGNAHNLGVVTPPLPESPSDSWLFRTLPSVSGKKATTSTFISRFSNNY
ncbi:hypothetical protein C2S52_011908 [Perilla frutescens var. hirtella]|nr:hypothetical protein C2S52_011908 [Perilla frutescens var. hirtella]KAH6785480.1 hypothetical protein C2S51_037935 [Perilla frutescens var. frutescens]